MFQCCKNGQDGKGQEQEHESKNHCQERTWGLEGGLSIDPKKRQLEGNPPFELTESRTGGISRTWPLVRLRGRKDGGVVWGRLELSCVSRDGKTLDQQHPKGGTFETMMLLHGPHPVLTLTIESHQA